MQEQIKEIFEKITERFQDPINIGKVCESSIYYNVQYLNTQDLNICANYLVDCIFDQSTLQYPVAILTLDNSYTEFSSILAEKLSNLLGYEIEQFVYSKDTNSKNFHEKNFIIATDVITTARSCLEAHSQVTVKGGRVACWVALIDRTFGPGPVPVIATLSGEPVTLKVFS